MATFAEQLPHFFLIVLLFTCCQTEARESKFFSKYVHLTSTTNKNYVTVPSTNPTKGISSFLPPTPSPSPITSQISYTPVSTPLNAPAPAPLAANDGHPSAPAPLTADESYVPSLLESEKNSYYGLYAKGSSDFPPEKESHIADEDEEEEEEFSNEELSSENPEELYNKESNAYTNGYSNNLSNNNGFWTSNHKGYTNGGGYKSNEPQGMSDTRLVDGGKYYYDSEHENYRPNGNELVRENNNEEGYNYGNYQKSKYEFDSMEEYEKQEGYADVQQEFIP